MLGFRKWAGLATLTLLGAGTPQLLSAQRWTMELLTSNEPSVTLTTESGDPRPTPSGTATFTLLGSGSTLRLAMTATFTGIDVTGGQTATTFDDLVNAHIHASAATDDPPTRPVVWGFLGLPDNDIDPSDLVVTPLLDGVGGTVTSVWNLGEGHQGTNLLAQLPNLRAGRAYVNFHTVQNRGGEIRGNFSTVPEPSTYALMAMGLVVLGAAARRRRQTS